MGRKRIYTDEERKQRKLESSAKYYAKNSEYYAQYNQAHKKEKAEYDAKRYQENKEKKLEQNAKWRAEHPDLNRASYLAKAYKRLDIKYNRGKCTLTARWIVDNIFPMPCHYCGAIGWEIMGCDRIDNSLPHTPDNVVPCCAECNKKRGTMGYEEFKIMIENGGKL